MDHRIDHVTVAGRDLNRLTEAFSAAGLPVEYGGHHSNGVTHMAIVGFPDGSYIELISKHTANTHSPWWNGAIDNNIGPCAWAIGIDDIETTTTTFRDRDVTVDGPTAYEREREDGTLVEWDLTSLEGGDPGTRLPFLIEDRTPRERRVQPTGALATSPVRGIDTVVIGVPDLATAVDVFTTAFDAHEPTRTTSADLQADIASFPELPVMLAEPTGDGWLAERVSRTDTSPAAYLIECERDVDHAFEDLTTGSITGQSVEWLPITHPVGHRYLGLIADK